MSEAKSFGGESGTALDKFPQPPCAEFLGYEFVSIDRKARKMRVKFTGTAPMLNPRGGVQGGFLTAMLDDAMGSMIVALTGGAKGPASVDIHTQFIRPAPPGVFECEAEVLHLGKSTAFTRATLYNDAGEIVATASQTARLIDIPGA